jgi:hypothetical protein
MKKMAYFIIITILLSIGFLSYQKVHIQNKFKNDENYVRENVLQKDSEGRGFSDIVKDKVEKQFADISTQISVKNVAKIKRVVVSARNEEEYIRATKQSLLAQNFIFFFNGK